MPYKKSDFESIIDGKTTRAFTMENDNGMVVVLTNYGAKIVSIYVPDKNGDFADVLLGFKSINDYEQYGASHGAVVGPFANRIANAQFTIDGETYHFPVNNGEACLHSGPDSWYRKVWDYEKNGNVTVFSLESPDGEFGFPGNKKVSVTYMLTNDNELKIEYRATTDKTTPVNLTHHSFFNLKGAGEGDVNDHIVQINADAYTPVDDGLIATGEIAPVEGTPMDFRKPTAIGERVDDDFEQLKFGNGYDHNWVLNQAGGGLTFAAKVVEPGSGRTMEVYTSEPGIQFYGGNFLDGTVTGKGGKVYGEKFISLFFSGHVFFQPCSLCICK